MMMYPEYSRKSFVFCALFAGAYAALAPDRADASTDNYVEIQIDTDVLTELMHDQFTGNTDFCPQEITCPGRAGGQCMVDHLEIGPPGYWSRASGTSNVAINSFTTLQTHKVLYTQVIKAHVKSMTCVLNPLCT